MNVKLMMLISKLIRLVSKGKFYEAIEVNKQITKILDTYKESC